MTEMTKRERVMAALKGDPVDRVPAVFFGHEHPAERSSDTLVAHMLEYNRKFDWDFIKVQNRNSFYCESWGCKYHWDAERGPEILEPIIKDADDYRKLKKQKRPLCYKRPIDRFLV